MSKKRTEKRRRRRTTHKKRTTHKTTHGGYRKRKNTSHKRRCKVDTPMKRFIEEEFDKTTPSSKIRYKVPMEKRFIYEER
jgi:hypothetical protein